MATFADYLDPVAPAKKSSVAQPTKEQMLGRQDLATVIKQFEAMLPDLVPGSASHTRTLENLQMARAELGKLSAAPAAPAAASLSAENQSLLNRNPAPVKAQQAAQPAKAPEVGTMADFLDTPIEAASETAPASKAEPKGLLSVAKGGVMKFLNQNPIKEGLSTLAEKTQIGPRAAGEFDTAFGVIPATYGAVVQGIARTANTPQAAEAIGKAASGSIEKPLGRIFGVTGKEAYQKPLGGITEPIAKEINRMANVLGLTPEQISERFGIPVEDVKQMAVTSSFVTPKVVGPVLAETAPAVKSAAATVAKPFQEMAKDLEVIRPGKLSKPEAQAQFDAKKGTVGSVGSAAVESSSLKQAKANDLLIPMGDDYTRAQLTRNPADVRYESDTAKHPVYGAPFQEKYAIQNDKLRKNLQAEVDNTGAELVGLPSADFGKTVISEPFQKYKSERYQQVSDAYTAADLAGETAQPVSYKNITDFIESETKNRPTRKEQNPLYALVEEEIKANDPKGTGQISIRQMEDIRKLINDEIDPQKKGSVRLGKKLKDNIDKSTENAGGDFYKKSRELNTKFNNDFEDIAVIRDINRNKKGLSDRVVPYEQLADKLVFKGPGSDLKSALETFEKMGPEGQKIIQELRGYAADKIMQESTKNVQLDVNNKPYVSTAALNKVVNELEKNGKLEMLFGKKGAERYNTLKDVTKELQTVPKDTTNPSGTAASIAAMLVESGVQFGVSGIPAPLVTGAVMLKNKMDTKKQLKKAEEYANPKNKISEMIK